MTIHDTVALEIQLWRLAELGIDFVDGCGIEDLFVSFDRSEYESEPYWLVLSEMGSESEKDGVAHLSDDVAALDLECIHSARDYVELIERVATLARNVVSITDPDVQMPSGAPRAEIAFRADGRRHAAKVPVRHDWIADEFLLLLGDAIKRHGGGARLLLGIGGGQDFMLCVGNGHTHTALQELTGPTFKWTAFASAR